MDEKIKNFLDKLPKAVRIGGVAVLVFIVVAVVGMFTSSVSKPSRYNPVVEEQSSFNVGGALGMPGSGEIAATDGAYTREYDMAAQKRASAPSIMPSPVPPTEPGYQGKVTSETQKKVIKTGDLSLVVESSSVAAVTIGAIAETNGGFVLSSNVYKTSGTQEEGYVSIKVPFEKFEGALKDIKNVAAQIKSETVTASDVTQEYVDLQAQIKNYESEEAQYREIMKRAVKISDVLEVQSKLSEVRGRIDMLQGRLNYLASQTDMSLITVRLSETPVVTLPQDQWQITTTVKEALNDLILTAQDFVDWLIFFVIVTIPSLIPVFLILWLAYYVLKFIWRKCKDKCWSKKEALPPAK